MSETSGQPAAQDDRDNSEAWRDDVSRITPSSVGQWLGLPALYFCVGVGYLVLLFIVAGGHGFGARGWVGVAGCVVFVLWAVFVALVGRRAAQCYDVAVSQQYQKLVAAGEGYLCVVVTAVGMATDTVGLVFLACFGLFGTREFRRRFTPLDNPTDFRRAILVLQDQVLLVEGALLIFGSVISLVAVNVVLSLPSATQNQYTSHDFAFIIPGVVALIWGVVQIRRLEARRPDVER